MGMHLKFMGVQNKSPKPENQFSLNGSSDASNYK